MPNPTVPQGIESTAAAADNASLKLPASLPYATGKPALSGLLRQQLDSFQVEEVLGFEPEGEGEHVFLFIEKRGLNTEQVVQQLARLAGLPLRQISYSGMKDRNAVTRQWFSVHLPGIDTVDFSQLNSTQLTVLRQRRHLRKLRRGVHQGNQFTICLSEIEGDRDACDRSLQRLSQQGFPNYFGEQRFGRGGQNLHSAEALFAGTFKPKKHLRGIYLSAARAYLFNEILSQRVRQGNWNSSLEGELLILNGSNSVFAAGTEDLSQRLCSGDIHPSGALFGEPSKLQAGGEVAKLETEVLSGYPQLTAGLTRMGLKAERRALRTLPQGLSASWGPHNLTLTFTLPSGTFATALLREMICYRVATPGSVSEPVQ